MAKAGKMPAVRGQAKNLVVRFIGDTSDLMRALAGVSAALKASGKELSGWSNSVGQNLSATEGSANSLGQAFNRLSTSASNYGSAARSMSNDVNAARGSIGSMQSTAESTRGTINGLSDSVRGVNVTTNNLRRDSSLLSGTFVGLSAQANSSAASVHNLGNRTSEARARTSEANTSFRSTIDVLNGIKQRNHETAASYDVYRNALQQTIFVSHAQTNATRSGSVALNESRLAADQKTGALARLRNMLSSMGGGFTDFGARLRMSTAEMVHSTSATHALRAGLMRGRDGSDTFASGMSRLTGRFMHFHGIAPIVLTRMLALGGAFFFLGASLIPVISWVGVMAGGLLALAATAGTLGAVYAGVAFAVVRHTQNMAAQGRALNPIQQAFISNVNRMKTVWNQFLSGAGTQTLAPINAGIRGITAGMRHLGTVVSALNPVIMSVATAFERWMSGEGLNRFVATIRTHGVPAMQALANAGRQFLGFLGHGFRAFAPVAAQLAGYLERGATALNNWAAAGGFQRWIQSTREHGPLVAAFFRELFATIGHLAAALKGLPSLLLEVVIALLNLIQVIPLGLIRAFAIAMMSLTAVKAVATALTLVSGAVRTLGFALSVFMKANPVMLIVSGLVLLGVAIYELATRTQFFQNIWNAAWGWIRSTFETVKNAIVAGWNVFITAIGHGWNTLWTGIRDFFVAIWNGLRVIAVATWNGLVAAFRVAMGLIGVVWSAVWSGVRDFFVGVWAVIRAIAIGTWNGLVVAFQAVAGFFTVIWQNLWNGVRTFFVAVWNGIRGVAVTIWNGLVFTFQVITGFFAAAWSGLWNGVRNFFVAVWNSIAGIAVGFWNGLVNTFRVMLGWISLAWTTAWNAVRNFIFGLWTAIRVRAQEFLTNIGNAFVLAWNFMTGLWTTVWNAIRNFIFGLWTAIRVRAQEFLANVGNAFVAAWNFITNLWHTVWNALRNFIFGLWTAIRVRAQEFLANVANAFVAAWNFIRNLWHTVWNSIRDFIFGLWTAIRVRAEAFLGNVSNAFVAAWNFINNLWRSIWNGIRDFIFGVWTAIRERAEAFLGNVVNAFQRAVDAVRTAWNAIRRATAEPINFVINRIWNDGLRKMINWIGEKIGLNWNLPEVRPVQFASGGYVSGPGGPTADKIPARLSDGEYVINAAATKRNLGLLDAINSGQINQRKMNNHTPGYQGGGPVRWQDLWNIVRGQFPQARLTSAFRPGDPGFHGRGMAIDIAGPRSMDMPYMLAMNKWIAGNFPGSRELIHTPGINLHSGRPHTYNAATRAQHFNHVHWANVGAPRGGGGGLLGLLGNIGSAIGMALPDWAQNPLEKLMDFVKGPFDEFGRLFKNNMFSSFAKVPIEMIKKAIDWIVNKIQEFVSSFFMGGDGNSIGAPGSGPVRDQVMAVAQKYNWHVGPEWAALQRLIQKESSWNPNAQNPRSTAYGLFQFLNSTWASVGARKTSNPAQQAEAGLRYIRQRYGSPTRALQFHLRNNWYDEGGWLEPGGFGFNTSGKPEAILDAQQSQAFMRRAEAGIGNTINIQEVNIYTQKLDKEELLRVFAELETLGYS